MQRKISTFVRTHTRTHILAQRAKSHASAADDSCWLIWGSPKAFRARFLATLPREVRVIWAAAWQTGVGRTWSRADACNSQFLRTAGFSNERGPRWQPATRHKLCKRLLRIATHFNARPSNYTSALTSPFFPIRFRIFISSFLYFLFSAFNKLIYFNKHSCFSVTLLIAFFE